MPRNALTAMTVMAVVLLSPASARAQSSAAATADVTADVVSGLTLGVAEDLDFGAVAQNAGVVSMAATSPNAAVVHLLAESGRRVDVTLVPPATLNPTSGTGPGIPYTWAASFNEDADDPAGATPFAALTEQIRPSENFGPQQRRAYIYLHGSIDVGSVSPGTYEATFTITAAY